MSDFIYNQNNSGNYFDISRKQVSNWYEQFGSINDKISSISVSTEKTFLKLGNQLQQFQSKSRAFSSKTRESVEQISTEIITDGVVRINEILAKFESHLNNSTGSINTGKEELTSILNHIESVFDITGEFKRLIKSLRMLGFSTKMESVRLNQSDNSFEILANKVESLSDVIAEKIKTIKDKSSLAVEQIKFSVGILESLGGKQLEQSLCIVENLNAAMRIFEEQSANCKSGSSEIADKSDNIYKSISDVVTSIQFHDITRQQLEHVKEALQEACEGYKKIDYTSENAHTKSFNESIQFTQNIINLQKAQLEHTSSELNGAISGIELSLSTIKGEIEEIYRNSESLFDENSLLGKDSFNTAYKDLELVTNYLIKNAGLGNDLSESVKSVVIIIDELAEHIQDVEEIGSEIELIALNSSIKAAHTGSKGLALGVLAESIQKFSIEAKKQTKQTTDILFEIENTSNALKQQIIMQSDQSVQNELIDANKNAREILNKIQQHTAVTRNNIIQIKKDVDDFGNELENSINEFEGSRKVSDLLNTVIDELNSESEMIKSQYNVVPQFNSQFNSLADRYTMHSERDIHSKFSDESDLGNNDKANGDGSEDDSEFGNNVELF